MQGLRRGPASTTVRNGSVRSRSRRSFIRADGGRNGAPGEIRTPGLLVRSQTLYPAELRAHMGGLLAKPYTDYQGSGGGAIEGSGTGGGRGYFLWEFERLQAAGAGVGAGGGGIRDNCSAISRPDWRTSWVTEAAVRRVASYSTRRVRAARSKLRRRMPYTSFVLARAKTAASVGGAV